MGKKKRPDGIALKQLHFFAIPPISLVLLVITWSMQVPTLFMILLGLLLVATVG